MYSRRSKELKDRCVNQKTKHESYEKNKCGSLRTYNTLISATKDHKNTWNAGQQIQISPLEMFIDFKEDSNK